MLSAKNLGLAGGIVWGVSLFILTIISMFTGYAEGFLNIMESLYPNFNTSPMGSLVGLGFGFVDGFIGCFLFAWIYNALGGHEG